MWQKFGSIQTKIKPRFANTRSPHGRINTQMHRGGPFQLIYTLINNCNLAFYKCYSVYNDTACEGQGLGKNITKNSFRAWWAFIHEFYSIEWKTDVQFALRSQGVPPALSEKCLPENCSDEVETLL